MWRKLMFFFCFGFFFTSRTRLLQVCSVYFIKKKKYKFLNNSGWTFILKQLNKANVCIESRDWLCEWCFLAVWVWPTGKAHLCLSAGRQERQTQTGHVMNPMLVCLCVLAVLFASVNVLRRCVSRLAEESGLCKFSFSKVSHYSLLSTPERDCSQIIPIYVSVQTKANICACVWLSGLTDGAEGENPSAV